MSPDQFTGKRSLVTGAARGIGRAVVERLAAEGSYVIVADLDRSEAEAVACALPRGAAEALQLDVADEEMVHHAADTIGPLDIVVANAGVQTYAPASELALTDWDRVHNVNARGTLLTLQLASRHLKSGGAAVAIASIQALLPNQLSAHYAASKAAVLSLTKSFAAELAPRGIRVNAVAPGRIDTELSDLGAQEIGRLTGQQPAEVLRRRISGSPLGRIGHPAEIAAAVKFLVSDDASYITGECLNVCGGDVMM